VNISDGDVVLSTFCSSCFLYLLLIMWLLVIPLLICGVGFIVVPFAVLLVLFVVTTHTRTGNSTHVDGALQQASSIVTHYNLRPLERRQHAKRKSSQEGSETAAPASPTTSAPCSQAANKRTTSGSKSGPQQECRAYNTRTSRAPLPRTSTARAPPSHAPVVPPSQAAHQTDTSPATCSTTRSVRPAQTVPGQARDLWMQACTHHIDEVLQAIVRGQGAGVSAATTSLMSLPARVLADSQASRRRGQRIVACLERIIHDEPIQDENSNDGPAPTARRPTRGPASKLQPSAATSPTATSQTRQTKSTPRCCSPPQTRSSLTSNDSTPRPTHQAPRSVRWPQPKFLQPSCGAYSAHFPEARPAAPQGGHTST
jgi:cytoskeletal protein RodZ